MCRATCALFVVLAFVLAVPTAAQESSPSGAKDDNDASLLERSQRHIDGLVTLPLDRELFGISGSGTLARQPDDNVDETALAQQAQNPVARHSSQRHIDGLVTLPLDRELFGISGSGTLARQPTTTLTKRRWRSKRRTQSPTWSACPFSTTRCSTSANTTARGQ